MGQSDILCLMKKSGIWSRLNRPDWVTNNDSVTFKIDLKEDFANKSQGEGVTVAEAPFTVKADYLGSEITNAKIEEIKDSESGFLGEYSVTIPLQSDILEGQLTCKREIC